MLQGHCPLLHGGRRFENLCSHRVDDLNFGRARRAVDIENENRGLSGRDLRRCFGPA